jgi:hypothetical protein
LCFGRDECERTDGDELKHGDRHCALTNTVAFAAKRDVAGGKVEQHCSGERDQPEVENGGM